MLFIHQKNAPIVEVGFTESGGFGGPHVRSFLITFLGKLLLQPCREGLVEIAPVSRIYVGIQQGSISSAAGSEFPMKELSNLRQKSRNWSSSPITFILVSSGSEK